MTSSYYYLSAHAVIVLDKKNMSKA